MKVVNVVAAIIVRDGAVFATQRGYGDFKGGWEFPGGKVEPGESEREAVARELKEELEMDVTVGELFDVVEYDYPTFHLSMKCYLCTVGQGGYVLKEHQDARWLSRDTIDEVEWLPADLGLIRKLKEDVLE